jgi:competence protein ComFC
MTVHRTSSRRPASPARRSLSALWDWLFPPRCVACDARGAWLCPACLNQIRCSSAAWQGEEHISPLQGARSAAPFEGPLREAIHEFKYEGVRVLASVLGDILHTAWCVDPWPAEIIVPVPLHSSRIRQRGYNQSALLSRELSDRTGLPVVESVLARIAPTRPQVGLSAEERADNVRNAFRCINAGLLGAKILLVDDVWTTGATMRACGQALLAGKAQAVWGLTLAHG